MNEGSEQILRSYDAMRAASMPLACRWSQYALMSQSAAMNFSSASQIGTSSGEVLLCSFWCHSSIIPPLQLFACWIGENLVADALPDVALAAAADGGHDQARHVAQRGLVAVDARELLPCT